MFLFSETILNCVGVVKKNNCIFEKNMLFLFGETTISFVKAVKKDKCIIEKARKILLISIK